MMAQYEHEQANNDKRNKLNSPPALVTTSDMVGGGRQSPGCDSPIPLIVGAGNGGGGNNGNETSTGSTDCTDNNCSSGASDLSISQRIKVEPDILLSQDDENSTNDYYMADLSKRSKQLEHMGALNLRPGDVDSPRNLSAAVCS